MRKFFPIYFLIIVLTFEVSFWIGRSNSALNTSADKAVAGEHIIGQITTHASTIMATSTLEAFFQADSSVQVVPGTIVSAVVPHHLLAGRYEADFFKQLSSQHPDVVVLVGPNHPNAGKNAIITGEQNWRTPYGELNVDTYAVRNLNINNTITINDNIIGEENSIGAVVPFIKKTWPNTKLIPIIVKRTATHEQLDALRNELYRLGYGGKKTLVIASVDFSHYLPENVASFHDELSANVLATADISRLNKLEVDSEPSLYFLLAYNKSQGAEIFHQTYHTNSAAIAGLPDIQQTTSHLFGYFTSGAATASPLIALQFFGDIMLDRNVAAVMRTSGLDYVLKNLHGEENRFFLGVDLFIANLEGPFAPTRIPTSKSIAFRFDPKWAAQLKKYNFGVVSLANNHTYDMGVKNVTFTRNLLASTSIGYFGDQLHEGSMYTWYATNTPEVVAFIGVENVTHAPDTAALKKAIDEARATARYVIVFAHMGTEYKQVSNTAQRNLYHWFIDNGVDVVVAAHPHVVQETEIYQGKPIFYSLGNFVFDQYFSKQTQEGLSVGLTLQDGKVKNIYFFPLQSVRSQDKLMSGKARTDFLSWMSGSSRLEGKSIINGKIEL